MQFKFYTVTAWAIQVTVRDTGTPKSKMHRSWRRLPWLAPSLPSLEQLLRPTLRHLDFVYPMIIFPESMTRIIRVGPGRSAVDAGGWARTESLSDHRMTIVIFSGGSGTNQCKWVHRHARRRALWPLYNSLYWWFGMLRGGKRMPLLSANLIFRCASFPRLSSQTVHQSRVTQFPNMKAVRNMSEQSTAQKSAATGLSHHHEFA